ncbi:sensor histidine kinase [Bacteroides nordii]|uniref:sensor histidine kinase n=2 Tax=Bacteroides nordii TaxID=291645 RepID=UPI00189F648F|nr:PAS domain-containing sensor histidine kinase [Bacteroides nordii]
MVCVYYLLKVVNLYRMEYNIRIMEYRFHLDLLLGYGINTTFVFRHNSGYCMNKYRFKVRYLPAFLPFLVGENSALFIIVTALFIVIVLLCIALWRLYVCHRVIKEIRVGDAVSRQLFDVWPLSILILSPEGRIERMNNLLLEELQLDMGRIAGKPITDIIELVQDKVNLLPHFLEKIVQGQHTISFSTNSFIREPHANISFLIQGGIVGVYDKGRLVKIVFYLRNVLEERTQRHVLNIALSKTQIFSWSFDMERNLMVIDPRYFDYLGIPTKDYTLTMEQYADLVHPDDRKELFEALGGQLTGNLYEAPVPFRLHRGDGSWEWFEGQSTYVGQLSDLPFRIVGICMSTQRHKDIEDTLNDALRKAQRSDQLKSAFLANMSHEIRTPLNAIVGFSTLLVSEQAEMTPEEVEEYAALIDKNGRLLMLLISDILDLSKIESNTMEFNIYTFSLNAMFADIARMQQMNMKSGVELIVDLPEEDTEITADSARLGQVVNNLINNAVKFTPVGSIRIGYRRTGEDMVELFVEDTGNGMSEEVLEHIFERFYKGDSFVQGTGLGLAICKTIVEHFYGEICVRSKPGEGARFDVRLPIGGDRSSL